MTNEMRERVESAITESNGALTVEYAKNMIAYNEKSLDSCKSGIMSRLYESKYEIVRIESEIAYYNAVIEILEEQEAVAIENEAPASEETVQPVPTKASSQKYNKSEIMTYAWRIYRNGTCTFRCALRSSWKKVKEALNTNTVTDLQAGDTVEMSIADTFQKATPMRYTVISISEALVKNVYYAVKFTDWYGNTSEYYMNPDSKINIVARASTSKNAA